MDESSWLACADPQVMRAALGETASGRKLRLFAAACCRRVWSMLGKGGRKTVVAAERFADGLIGPDELRQARERGRRDAPTARKWWNLRDNRTAYANDAPWHAADEGDPSDRASLYA